jgi:hypothetical protein
MRADPPLSVVPELLLARDRIKQGLEIALATVGRPPIGLVKTCSRRPSSGSAGRR